MSSTDLPISRARLSRVIRDAGDVVQTDRVAQLLEVGHTDASKLLARWAAQGWLKRVGPGVYLSVTIDALGSDRVLADPWILVPVLFAPGYISGWSAAEHWDLTEQIFNDIVVKTCRPLRSRTRKVHGVSFVLRHIKEEHLFGTKTRWRGQTRVRVADIHRCLVDMLDEPYLGGGIQHVADCFRNYIQLSAKALSTLSKAVLRTSPVVTQNLIRVLPALGSSPAGVCWSLIAGRVDDR